MQDAAWPQCCDGIALQRYTVAATATCCCCCCLTVVGDVAGVNVCDLQHTHDRCTPDIRVPVLQACQHWGDLQTRTHTSVARELAIVPGERGAATHTRRLHAMRTRHQKRWCRRNAHCHDHHYFPEIQIPSHQALTTYSKKFGTRNEHKLRSAKPLTIGSESWQSFCSWLIVSSARSGWCVA